MKNNFLFTFFAACLLLVLPGLKASSQIMCISCYDQNDSISYNVNNLLLNGGFEQTDCAPWPASDRYCPNSYAYSCDLDNWTCTGGGTSTYACTFDHTYVFIPQGNLAAYFGNSYCHACSNIPDDTSCLVTLDCTAGPTPPGFPANDPAYGGTTGVSIQQTVTGLTPGDGYVLEFWTGGEWSYTSKGLFALDVGFGDTLLRCKPTDPSQIGTEYIVQFVASSPSHTIKFTNWGHICSSCTELVLDNVRLYSISELDTSVIACISQGAPSSSFAVSDTDICEKFCINFYDSSQNNPTSWLWEFPGGIPSSSTDQNPQNVCYNTPGIYDVTLITSNGGNSDTLLRPGYITVYTNPFAPVISQTANTLTSTPATSYQWQFNSVDIPGATNQSYIISQSGLYTVIIGDGNGCTAQASVDASYVGIDEVDGRSIVNIYPNPSPGKFIVELLNGLTDADVTIDVMNPVGQTVFSSEEKISNNHQKEIDLSDVPTGIYFLEIKSSNFSLTKKIVIGH